MMKTKIFMFWAIPWWVFAQGPSLSTCIELSLKNSPINLQKSAAADATQLQNGILKASSLPRAVLSGLASVQSQVTELPISLPNILILPPPKDQYRTLLEVQHTVFDGGLLKNQRLLNEAQGRVEASKFEVDLFSLQETVTQLYATASLLVEQNNVLELYREQMVAKAEKLKNGIQNGVATKNQWAALQTQLLGIEQQIFDHKSQKEAIVLQLESLMNEKISPDAAFVLDEVGVVNDPNLQRSEVLMLQSQQELSQVQKKVIMTKYTPKVVVSGTAGYGRPGLNMLATSFSPYGLASVSLRVPVDQWYSNVHKKERQMADIQSDKLGFQIQTYKQQQNLRLLQKAAEINRIEQNIKTDGEIISLRKLTKAAVEAQFDHGTATASDFVDETNNELMALRNLALHKIQLKLAKIQYRQILGK